MSTLSLFPEHKLDRAARIDRTISELLEGRHGGPLGLHLTDEETSVLRAIRYQRGAAHAISIRELQGRLKINERSIKKHVRTLRMNFSLPIGSSKGEPGGYFIILTPEDMAIFIQGPLQQIRAELAVLHAIAGPRQTAELLGQLRLEVTPE